MIQKVKEGFWRRTNLEGSSSCSLMPKGSKTSGKTSKSTFQLPISPSNNRVAYKPLLSPTVVNRFTSYVFGYGDKGPDEEDKRTLAAFLLKVPGLVKAGKLKNIPVKKFDSGLDKVASDGFDYIAKGKVSAEKIVYEVRGSVARKRGYGVVR